MAGCMVQRFPQELARELPEVDHFIGTADLPVLAKILAGKEQRRIAVGSPEGLSEQNYERALIGAPHSVYLKISEGCDRRCAFCIIPALRGAQRSRTIDSLVTEAKQLVAAGAKELNLVAQDTTAYGRDLDAPTENLIALLEALDRIECLSWIRLLYAYPSAVTPQLVLAMAQLSRVVPYLDLPIQHVDDSLLRRMHRGYTNQHLLEVLKMLRSTIPEIYLRTTLITGHPGETEESQARLLDFIEAQQLDHVGVFPFSCEENTASATQSDQVPTELAQKRAQQVMQRQRQISRQKLSQLRGKTMPVLIEGSSPESEYLLQGRFYGQAPDVDGVVIVTSSTASPGELIQVEITDSADYDLVAKPASRDENR
jgi:ribosomal protein S12 methylthiotransferase